MPNTAADSPAGAVQVAVAVLCNDAGAVLLTRRHAQTHQGGLWEFPGGKVETGESVLEALSRELREELAVEVSAALPMLNIEHDYGDKRVCLHVHRVTAFSGEPRPCEGQPMRWVPAASLPDYPLPAANRTIVDLLLAEAVG